MTAFAGESQAHTKYLYYASKAIKDGYVQIGKLFEETARNEKEHAKIWFKYLHGGEVPDTVTNLSDAAAGGLEADCKTKILRIGFLSGTVCIIVAVAIAGANWSLIVLLTFLYYIVLNLVTSLAGKCRQCK